MICGIGIDICDSRRIQKNLLSYGKSFTNIFLTDKEKIEASIAVKLSSYVASRFSAKEAFYKAFNSSNQKFLNWKDIHVLNSLNNKPEIHLSENTKNILLNSLPIQSIYSVKLSIAFDKIYIISKVMIMYHKTD